MTHSRRAYTRTGDANSSSVKKDGVANLFFTYAGRLLVTVSTADLAVRQIGKDSRVAP